jgi:hypothetical protein
MRRGPNVDLSSSIRDAGRFAGFEVKVIESDEQFSANDAFRISLALGRFHFTHGPNATIGLSWLDRPYFWLEKARLIRAGYQRC